MGGVYLFGILLWISFREPTRCLSE